MSKVKGKGHMSKLRSCPCRWRHIVRGRTATLDPTSSSNDFKS